MSFVIAMIINEMNSYSRVCACKCVFGYTRVCVRFCVCSGFAGVQTLTYSIPAKVPSPLKNGLFILLILMDIHKGSSVRTTDIRL